MVCYRSSAGLAAALVLLTGAAFAAAPDPLATLPSLAVGVIGSGDQLTLQLRENGALRTVAIGAEYRDGWRVQSLTPTLVTLEREGVTRRVGLNPSGGVVMAAEAGAGPEIVTVLSAEDLVLLQQQLDTGRWNGQAKRGLTLDETRRQVVCTARWMTGIDPRLAQMGPPPPLSPECDRLTRTTGKADLNWMMANTWTENERRVHLGQPPVGPDSFYVARGVSIEEAARLAGAPGPNGYTRRAADASGGYMMTKPAVGGPPLIAQLPDGSWDYVASINRTAMGRSGQ